MTEAGGNVTFPGPDDHRLGLTGHPEVPPPRACPTAAVEVRVVGDDGFLADRYG
ncbi:MAG: hypothetical protein H6518_15540 [Microthrixaceae bacterium]|nr:hypothetical protein [Microthrixaceae bacterium]